MWSNAIVQRLDVVKLTVKITVKSNNHTHTYIRVPTYILKKLEICVE